MRRIPPGKHKLNHAIGATIKDMRENKVLSQNDLGLLTGMHRSYVGDIEQGTRNISVWNLVRIGLALETSGAAILDVAEPIWRRSIKR